MEAVSRNGMVVLCGDRGTGKTQMMVEAMREWYVRGGNSRTCRYCTSTHIALALSPFRPRHEQMEKARSRYCGTGLLCIDEWQRAEALGAPTKMSILDILDHRYGAKRPTIIATNEMPDSWARTTDPSLVDRVRETGGTVECDWESFRT